jgi:hypothetical protein
VVTRVGWQPGRGNGVVVKKDLTTSVAVAIWRAHNSNLVLRRGRRSDVDGRQGDVIPISDQVKQRTKHRPTTADPACAQTAATSLWSMLQTVAPAVVDRRSCGLISAAAGSGGGSQISTAAAWIWRRGGRLMRERCPSTT